MEVSLDLTKRYSYADYLTWMDDKRREIIDGFVKMMSPAASLTHARISRRLMSAFDRHIDPYHGGCEIFDAPFDVRLPKNGEREDNQLYTVVQPDICVVCDPSKLDGKGCLGAPDMIIEILSPANRKYDLNDKYRLYERSGVKEYWVIEPKNQDVTVFLLDESGKYADGVFYSIENGNTKIPVNTLPGLEIDAEKIFNNL
jgi:Uma2 family endonuclease